MRLFRDLLPLGSNLERFGKVIKLVAFKPFTSAADALEQINAVSESQLTDELKNFLEVSLPKVRDLRPTSHLRPYVFMLSFYLGSWAKM